MSLIGTELEKQFRQKFEMKLGDSFGRALLVVGNYGPLLFDDVSNALQGAFEAGKVSEVLALMEEHFRDHLGYQHPELRGLYVTEPTKRMLYRIYREILAPVPR